MSESSVHDIHQNLNDDIYTYVSSPISSKFQAQFSPSSSTPIRRDRGESYRSTKDPNIDNDKTEWTLCFLCQKQKSE